MGIEYNQAQDLWKLDTPHTSYAMALADKKWLGHVYYGPRIGDMDLAWALRLEQPPFTPNKNQREEVTFFDCFPSEYPVENQGDLRETCLAVRTEKNQVDCLPVFDHFEILPGKPELSGLPATFGTTEDCATLKLVLKDDQTHVTVELYYTAFNSLDVITRSVVIRNQGSTPVWIDKALSCCLSLPYEDQQLVTLHGSWAREQQIQFQEIGRSYQGTASRRGISSHQDHPFLAVASRDITQTQGQVYAMHFVYSGSFLAQAQRDQHDQLRLVMGIHPESFCWKLEPGAAFQTPEVVQVYSGQGLGQMTRTFHDLYRGHLIRSKYQFAPRPVLINNWEATYFDFDEEKLLSIARHAAELGIELFVLDDGWFGNRNTDSGSLGDWQVNRKKLPDGLGGLSEKINALGMGFGLWMEPEMVSMDSWLYRAHPDWAIQTASRRPMLCRDQFLLDLSRPEVEEYVWNQISQTLHSGNITYLKWDMNRPMTNIGSASLPADRQGELSHRYVLALYRLQQRLLDEFPDLLLENCCSGGGRFDPGMLYYSPQIWCSDDTDAVERLRIQEGTAMLYPLSSIGAHVSACPNHAVGRVTPFETRAVVAMSGTFGYELDVRLIPPEDQRQIPGQIQRYKKYQSLIQTGDYFRLSSSWTGELDAQMIVSKDKQEALLTVVTVLNRPNQRPKLLKLAGLAPQSRYQVQETGETYSGEALLQLGFPLTLPTGDFQSRCYHLIRTGE